MEIRLLHSTDAADYKRIRLEALQQSPENFGSSYEEEIEHSDERWLAAITKNSIFGAFINSMLVGIAGFYRLDAAKTMHRGLLVAMYVQPQYRQRGIASSLVEAIIHYAKTIGVSQLCLDCTTSNEGAFKLYQKHGFRSYGIEPRSLKIGDKFFDLHMMVLEL